MKNIVPKAIYLSFDFPFNPCFFLFGVSGGPGFLGGNLIATWFRRHDETTVFVEGQRSAQLPSVAAVVPSASNLISRFVELPCDGGSFRESCQQTIQG